MLKRILLLVAALAVMSVHAESRRYAILSLVGDRILVVERADPPAQRLHRADDVLEQRFSAADFRLARQERQDRALIGAKRTRLRIIQNRAHLLEQLLARVRLRNKPAQT